MAFNRDKRETQEDALDEHTVFINRCAKTVKGGRRMSFSAVIVVGDKEGSVGVGFGKANEVADAIRKGGEAARKAMHKVVMKGSSIPHDVEGVCDGGRVILKPAPTGTGGGRHPRRRRQVARLQEPPQRGQGHAQRALQAPLGGGDRRDQGVTPKGEHRMELSNLTNTPGARKSRKRVGRGCGSGLGKTAGKGQKGQQSRKGHKHKLVFEGGQMPLVRRLPKRGFNNAAFAAKALAVNLSDLEKKFETGAEITVAALAKAGFSDNKRPKVKILGKGSVTKKFSVKGVPCSASAKAAIEAAGGSVA